MIDEKSIPGGVVHDLPEDIRAALNRDPAALSTRQDITPSRAQRMDLLDRVGEKDGNSREADPLGLRKP